MEKCLDSLIQQTLQDIEIICVDDGSTDGSGDILKQYAQRDSRIRVIQKKNEGAGQARNDGFDLAKGDYVAFLDGDDYFEPEMLEALCQRALETDSQIVNCDVFAFDEATGAEEIRRYVRSDMLPDKEVMNWRDIPKWFYNAFSPVIWNKLYSREALAEWGSRFKTSERTEDPPFFMETFTKASRISVVQEPYPHYRMGRDGSLQNLFKGSALVEYEDLKQFRKQLQEEGIYQDLETAFKRKTCQVLDYVYGHLDAARQEELIQKLKTDPEPFFSLDYNEPGIRMRKPYLRLCKLARKYE